MFKSKILISISDMMQEVKAKLAYGVKKALVALELELNFKPSLQMAFYTWIKLRFMREAFIAAGWIFKQRKQETLSSI